MDRVNKHSHSTSRRWLSPQQAAAYLGCSKNFLDKDRITRLHGIPWSRLGRHIKYDQFDLDAYMERAKAQSVGVQHEQRP